MSQYASSPRQLHFDVVLRILWYLKATPGQCIFLPSNRNLTLKAFCDSYWLGCPLTRCSKIGYFITLGGAVPISWQSMVARSSDDAEYRAMTSTVSEIMWFRWLLEDLEAPQSGPISLYCDNKAARHCKQSSFS